VKKKSFSSSHITKQLSTGNAQLLRQALPWGLICVLCVFYWYVAASEPDTAGGWQDDGIYITTARSLAQGTGYRHIENPGSPYQTKYPILYPAILSVALRFFPGYPLAPALFLSVALTAAVFVVASLVFMRRVLGMSRAVVLATAALAAFSPSIVSLARFILTDFPYACLSVLALLCIDGRYASARSDSCKRIWLIVGALLVAAAMHTRSFGITLAAAVIIRLMLRRRWTDAVLAAVVIVLCMSPWWCWQVWASYQNGALEHSVLLTPDLAYSAFAPNSIIQSLRTVWQNIFRTFFGIAYFELALPESFFLAGMREFSWRTIGLHGLVYSLIGLLAVGFRATVKKSLKTIHIYFLLYTVFMLAWPFEPYRFIIVWTPFLLCFLVRGIEVAAARILQQPRSGSVVASAAAILLAAFFVHGALRNIGSRTESFYRLGQTAIVLKEDQAAADYLRRMTKDDDVIASALPARLFLQTGRRGVCLWHDNDPFDLYSGPERTWQRFYVDGDSAEFQYRQIVSGLEAAYAASSVRYMLVNLKMAPHAVLRFVSGHPELFNLIWQSPESTHQVFRFTPQPDTALKSMP